MSLVVASDYEVPDFSRWWGALTRDDSALRHLSAHHLVVYRSLDNGKRVFVTIGIRDRQPLELLLRSPFVLEWFDQAGVEEIPPVFVGQVVEKLELTDAAPDRATSGAGVIVAAIVPVSGVDRLQAAIHQSVSHLRSAGVQRLWTYRALDDGHEVMILHEIDTEGHAARWLDHPEESAAWLANAGIGVYPPLFVGRLVRVIEPRHNGDTEPTSSSQES
jgi:hypothetical protein